MKRARYENEDGSIRVDFIASNDLELIEVDEVYILGADLKMHMLPVPLRMAILAEQTKLVEDNGFELEE